MSANDPIVHFPNLFIKAHAMMVCLIAWAWDMNVLPSRKYGHLSANLPEGYRPETESLADTYLAIGKVCVDQKAHRAKPNFSLLGEILGINNKHLIEDIARCLFIRAIAACTRIEALVTNPTVRAEDIAGSRDMAFFSNDIVLLSAVLNSRCVWVHGNLLTDYLDHLSNVQTLVGFNPEVDVLCRKLKAITRSSAPAPKPVHPNEAETVAMPDPQTEDTKVIPMLPDNSPSAA